MIEQYEIDHVIMWQEVYTVIDRMPEKNLLELFRALGFEHGAGTSIGRKEINELVTQRIMR